MSELLEKIKQQQKALRLIRSEYSKHQASALTVILGEVDRLPKDAITDEAILKILKKALDGVNESLGYTDTYELQQQKIILDRFIPRQLTAEEIRLLIVQLGLPGELSIGDVQKHFKLNHTGRYDAKLVTEGLKSLQGATANG